MEIYTQHIVKNNSKIKSSTFVYLWSYHNLPWLYKIGTVELPGKTTREGNIAKLKPHIRQRLVRAVYTGTDNII